MLTPFAQMIRDNWPVTLSNVGVTGTITDDAGQAFTVAGKLIPRSDEQALDGDWETRARQVEFHCVAPDGFVLTPRESTLTVAGVQYTILSEGATEGAVARYLCERIEIESIRQRGRRY